jgi:hypothetical protein
MMHRAGIQAADTSEQIAQITEEDAVGTTMKRRQLTAGNEDCLASVIVPRATSTRDITVLETAMQGLALDKRHPVALELSATASSRQFLLRATSRMSQKHLADQVQARYPQAIIRPMDKVDDPLVLQEGETVSAIELRAGAAAYLPLRIYRERELLQEGADPLLGILGVFNHLPPHLRVVAQLALLPASPTWSYAYRRKSIEHPLEQERLRARRELSGAQANSPSTFRLVGMGIVVALLLIGWRFKQQLNGLFPLWLLQAGTLLLHGKTPQLSSAHVAALEIGGFIALAVLFCLAFVVLQIRNRLGGTPLYDMRLVDEKTGRSAYRIRLRLFVFSDEARSASTPPVPLLHKTHHTCSSGRGVPYVSSQSFTWSLFRDAYHRWRTRAQRTTFLKQEQHDVLDHLVAAYRQYHTAAGGYFVSSRLSQGKAQRLVKRQTGWLRSRWTGWEHDLATSSHLLSVADIASLWHLPQTHDLFDLPFVERLAPARP